MRKVKIGSDRHGNLQKHTSSSGLQTSLIQRFHEKIIEQIQRTGANKMLDAGCGEGFLLEFLYEQGLKVNYFGSDIGYDAIAWSRANLIPDFQANVTDIHRLPYSADSFPLVICLEVLEHLPDSTLGLRELARVSSDYVLVSVPHEPYFRGANFLRGKHLSRWGNDPEHIQNYSGRSFRQMLSTEVDIVWHGYSFPWQIALAKKHR